jgi:hypothetical protein
VFAVAIALAFIGRTLSGQILDRMSDKSFLAWTK